MQEGKKDPEWWRVEGFQFAFNKYADDARQPEAKRLLTEARRRFNNLIGYVQTGSYGETEKGAPAQTVDEAIQYVLAPVNKIQPLALQHGDVGDIWDDVVRRFGGGSTQMMQALQKTHDLAAADWWRVEKFQNLFHRSAEAVQGTGAEQPLREVEKRFNKLVEDVQAGRLGNAKTVVDALNHVTEPLGRISRDDQARIGDVWDDLTKGIGWFGSGVKEAMEKVYGATAPKEAPAAPKAPAR